MRRNQPTADRGAKRHGCGLAHGHALEIDAQEWPNGDLAGLDLGKMHATNSLDEEFSFKEWSSFLEHWSILE